MTKSPRKNVPDVGIELGAACMPSELASDRATAPVIFISLYSNIHIVHGSQYTIHKHLHIQLGSRRKSFDFLESVSRF